MNTRNAIDLADQILPAPALVLRDGRPFSTTFDDIYHQGNGIDEGRRVFLELSALTQRFSDMGEREQFHVAELGFGTGLNALLTTQLFCRVAPAGACLHYTGFEALPLRRADLELLTPLRSAVADLHALLCRIAPPPIRGWHRRWLHPRVRLSLFHGDARAGLGTLLAAGTGAVDAWFLDGFAPDKNPELWGEDIIKQMGELSTTGTTVATFTSVGAVRRRLNDAGFAVKRVAAHPHKRHYACGHWVGAARHRIQRPAATHIIGAGIAGSALAVSLRARGGDVSLSDIVDTPPGGASRNPAAALQTRLPQRLDDVGCLRLSAYTSAAGWLDLLQPGGWQPNGLLHLSLGRDKTWLRDYALQLPGIGVYLEADAASARAGMTLPVGGIFLTGAGHADLRALCRALLRDADLRPAGANDARPLVQQTVLATPLAGYGIEFRAVPGTVTCFAGPAPSCPLSGDGYVLPLDGGGFAAGGTYDREPAPASPAEASTAEASDSEARRADARNAARATRFGFAPPTVVLRRFKGVRHSALDRMPMVGRLPSRAAQQTTQCPAGSAEWISSGFASSGLAWAHLAAEILVSQWCLEPPPATPELISLLNPLRALGQGSRPLGK